jgi:hypothetical protein
MEIETIKTTSLKGPGIFGYGIARTSKILSLCFLMIVCFLAACISKVEAEERLLYTIRYESLQRYPDILNTRIYSFDLNKKVSHLIFSDENSPILILPRRGMPGHPGEVLVSSKNRIFAHAVERRLKPNRWYPYKASIYELSVDGSHKSRKIFDVLGDQSLSVVFVNSAGTKIAYINYLGQKTFIFVHDTETGRLLHKINTSDLFLDCYTSTIGWLPDGINLFFTLDTGDMHITSHESYKKKGAYIIKEDGTELTKIQDKLILFPLEEGFWRATDGPPQFIGGSPDGTYIFRDAISKKDYGRIETSFLIYRVNPLNKSQIRIPFKISGGLKWFKLSHTGEYIAFTEKIYSKDGTYQWIEHLWIKDLVSGEENNLFSLDNRPFKGRYFGLVGWIQN